MYGRFVLSPLEEAMDNWNAAVTITNIILTTLLIVFAGMQWWVTKKGEEREREEFSRARQLQEDAVKHERNLAYQFAWAEYLRLDSLASHWEESSLIDLSLTNSLDPKDLKFEDPTRFIDALAALSPEAAHLGSLALTMSREQAVMVQDFNGTVHGWLPEFHRYSYLTRMSYAKQVMKPVLESAEGQLRLAARGLANLVLEAGRRAPGVDLLKEHNFESLYDSEYVRKKLAEFRSSLPPANGAQ
jgi:hypothetical protein